MQETKVSLSEIKLVGIKIRTNNMAEGNPNTAKIANMASQYFQNSLPEAIPHRKTPGVTFIAYAEYESNYKGEYTCFIGEEVTQIDNLPENLVVHIIPAQNYNKFTNEAGALPNVVIKAWQEIWQMKELEVNRSYKTDFEIYDQRAMNPASTILDIYIGVR